MISISNDLTKGFEEISEHYSMAQEILDLAGVSSPDYKSVEYQGGRIRISGSTENLMLTIDFDNRANTGKDYWGRPLSVSSLGTIQHLSQPHLSEAEAKEGRSKYRFIQWHTFLKREYDKVKKAVQEAA